MEKRKVTISICGKPCSFYSDDPEEYISALEQRVNAAMKQTAGFSGSSAYTNALLTVVFLTDQLLRTEQRGTGSRKNVPKTEGREKDKGQVTMWDLLDDQREKEMRGL